MPLTFDDSKLTAFLDTLPARIKRGAERGLASIAPVVEQVMQTSPAHGDITGAAHASSVAVVLDAGAQAKLDAAYGIAAQLIAAHTSRGFSGHGGQAERIDVDVAGEGEAALLLARPINYGQALEDEGKAVVRPTLQQYAGAIHRAAADGIKEELR